MTDRLAARARLGDADALAALDRQRRRRGVAPMGGVVCEVAGDCFAEAWVESAFRYGALRRPDGGAASGPLFDVFLAAARAGRCPVEEVA